MGDALLFPFLRVPKEFRASVFRTKTAGLQGSKMEELGFGGYIGSGVQGFRAHLTRISIFCP